LYQQSSLRQSGSRAPGGPLTGGQGRPEHEGTGGALGGRGTDARGTGRLLFFSTSSRHWTGTVEAARNGQKGVEGIEVEIRQKDKERMWFFTHNCKQKHQRRFSYYMSF